MKNVIAIDLNTSYSYRPYQWMTLLGNQIVIIFQDSSSIPVVWRETESNDVTMEINHVINRIEFVHWILRPVGCDRFHRTFAAVGQFSSYPPSQARSFFQAFWKFNLLYLLESFTKQTQPMIAHSFVVQTFQLNKVQGAMTFFRQKWHYRIIRLLYSYQFDAGYRFLNPW